jgi:flagellar hook capping protein FlgD
MKKKNLLLAGFMIFSLCAMNPFASAQLKPEGKTYKKCDCSLPNYGCKSRPCLQDCERVCTFFLIKPSAISISKTEKVIVQIFDATGRLVKAFRGKEMLGGNTEINWDKKDDYGNAVSPGIYFATVNAGNHSETKKISISK